MELSHAGRHMKMISFVFLNQCLAFHDNNPQAPIHVLLIPKNKDGLKGISYAEERHKQLLGELMYRVKVVADAVGLSQGYRVVINNGEHAGQSVFHLHLHILGGAMCSWPPGTPGPNKETEEKK